MEPLIEFCEEKYVYTPYIAEYYNTISNLAYIVTAIFILLNDGNRNIADDVFMIGIGSALFHGYPNLLTEITDEVWIILLVCDAIMIMGGRNLQYHALSIYFLGIAMEEFVVFYTILTLLSVYAIYLIPRSERTFDIVFFMFIGQICWYLEQWGGYCQMHILWHIFSAISLYHLGIICRH